jgi:glucose 1-dehydrogenase
MRAITVRPGEAGSLELSEMPEPTPGPGELLVDAIAVGVCGTDREIANAEYGWAPPGQDRLILGHESLGRVRTAAAGSGFAEGDLVVGVVRRPDPKPCGACARGQFDMCRNGEYTERGIKELHGYASERWTVEAEYAVKLPAELGAAGVLMEPMSVVAKAWEQVDRIGARAWYEPRTVLVTGAGPLGLLAALLGTQRGLDVHVLDIVTEGPKPRVVAALGATYHSETMRELTRRLRPDVVIEATGVSSVVIDAIGATAEYGIVCLTGVSVGGRKIGIDIGGANRSMVLENDVIVGSVNANLSHFRLAAEALVRADQDWLLSLITRRTPLDQFDHAMTPDPDGIKHVIDIA